MTRSPLRLTLPATPRTTGREELRFVVPRRLREQLSSPGDPSATAGPVLLAFHGTGFIEEFFALSSGQGPLPLQRAWRDWCEPPASMLARSGTPAYPATIRRSPPLGLPEEARTIELEADGIPRGTPPWLRKIYLPQHDRFTLVAFELICRAAGWPPLDRARVKEAGMVVRRLRRGDPAGAEQWEDWIARDNRHGSWEPSLGALDPARLGNLTSQPLALVPRTLPGAERGCLLYGYLSLTSAEQELPPGTITVASRTEAATALRQRAETQLNTLAAATPSASWLPPKELLLSLLRDTVLPPATTSTSPGSTNDADLEDALKLLVIAALDSNLFTNDVTGSVITGENLWTQAVAVLNLSSGTNGDVRARLEQLLDLWFTGQALPSDLISPDLKDQLLPALVTAALVRARGCRLALAALMNGAQGEPVDDLNTIEADRARHSLADLGEGLDSFWALEEERGSGGGLAPWKSAIIPQGLDAERLKRLDRTLRALAEHYAPFEAQLAEAGAQVRFVLREQADELERNMVATIPGMPSLLEQGVDLLEPPALGLLLLPGLGDALASRITEITTKTSARYQDAARSEAQPVAEALVAQRLTRPRFDAHHIYAVWAWVRVAGRTQAEPERVIWSPRSEPFVLAEPMDLLGSQPQAVLLPDLPRLLRDLTRLHKAGANPYLTLVPPPRSGAESGGGGLEGLRRDWGLGTPVALVAPVLAIAGLGLLTSALRTFSLLPGFAWVRQVVFRSPAPRRRA